MSEEPPASARSHEELPPACPKSLLREPLSTLRERRTVSVRHMAPFVPLHENSVTLKLSPLPNDAPYIIMPCTFGAGQRGPFSLGATADGDFELLPLPDVMPPNT